MGLWGCTLSRLPSPPGSAAPILHWTHAHPQCCTTSLCNRSHPLQSYVLSHYQSLSPSLEQFPTLLIARWSLSSCREETSLQCNEGNQFRWLTPAKGSLSPLTTLSYLFLALLNSVPRGRTLALCGTMNAQSLQLTSHPVA